MLRPTKSRGADRVVLPKRISCESWDADGRGITGTANEMRKGVGLARLFENDLGPQMGLVLEEALMPWGVAWGRQLNLRFRVAWIWGQARRLAAHTMGIFPDQSLADLSSQGLLSLAPAATSNC